MGKLGITAEKLAARLARALVLALLLLGAPLAAQSTTTYTTTNTGTVNNTNCTTSFSRTFNVTANVLITEIELGIRATGTYRRNMRVTLQSPAGTTVQLISGAANPPTNDGNNLNVLLDDDAAQVINTTGLTTNHGTTGPPYEFTFRPNNALSAFDDQVSTGTWTLRMCEVATTGTYGDIGFARADLYVTGTTYSDVSLTKTVSNATRPLGSTVSYTVTVTNATGVPASATGVVVTDLLPAGVAYTTHSASAGTYNPGSGVWTVGTLTAGQSRTLTISATVTATAGAPITNTAEVTASSPDRDSTPDNGVAAEDDMASATFTVSGTRVAGTPPALACPKGTILFDWDTRAWTTAATSANFAVTGIGTVAFNIANPGAWMNQLGGMNPIRQNQINGGFTGQYSLAEAIDFANRNQVATTTITLPVAVDGAQFRLFDVDYGADTFADRVVVTGSFDGSPVTPVLTNGVANYVIGNQAFGDGVSDNTSANGNLVITFQSAVDTIVIEYGNYSAAPANPVQQAITIHDITFCQPFADISVTKVSSLLSDPIRGSTNPLMIPGATLSYCILVTNSGNAWAGTVVANDTLPATMTYVAGTMRSGASCAAATTVEDDNATGADETDPLGASVSGSALQFRATTLDHNQAIAFTFSATVN